MDATGYYRLSWLCWRHPIVIKSLTHPSISAIRNCASAFPSRFKKLNSSDDSILIPLLHPPPWPQRLTISIASLHSRPYSEFVSKLARLSLTIPICTARSAPVMNWCIVMCIPSKIKFPELHVNFRYRPIQVAICTDVGYLSHHRRHIILVTRAMY